MAFFEASQLFRALDPVVWVVTSSAFGQDGGLLATFVNSASIVGDAPRALVGIAKRHRTWELIAESGAYALHLLPDDARHRALATRFGLESSRDVDKFADSPFHREASGSPILDNALGWLDCQVEARFDTGDRTLYLGAVVDARAPGERSPLTVRRWIDSLNLEEKARLGRLYGHDATLDADAIRDWRAERSPR